MKINFEAEVKGLNSQLKVGDGYLDCEHIIVTNIKKQIHSGAAIPEIENYLKQLRAFFEDKVVINKGNMEAVNFRYAAGFLDTVIATPFWQSWMQTSGKTIKEIKR